MSIVKLHCQDLWYIPVFDIGYNSSDISFILYVVLYYRLNQEMYVRPFH